MKLPVLVWLLFFNGVACSLDNCSFYHIVKHLQLEQEKGMHTMVRPVYNPNEVTNVTLDVMIYAILDLQEKEQKCISYLWTDTFWYSDFIRWDPDQFCGVKAVGIPTDSLWKPDIIIEDMIEKDRSAINPYMMVFSSGAVVYRNEQVVVSTCKISAYQFPFDTQRCKLTFRSAMYTDKDINLSPAGNSSETTQWSKETLRTQYEWIFVNLTVREKKGGIYKNQDMIIYSILMKRRWGLYVVNYILPLLCFFILDFASFFISDSGDKVTFKITVLLAVTVMQLLFNEILPTSTQHIPLIAIFCIGIFLLMLLSLAETLFVLYLINKDGKEEQDDPYRRLKDAISLNHSNIPSTSDVEKVQPSEHVLNALIDLLQNKKEEEGPGYWTKKATLINRVFFVFYTTTATVFLGTLFYLWSRD